MYAGCAMRVIPVPCLSDNYAYLIVGQAQDASSAAVVDPSEAEPVLAAAEREGLSLRAILCTHHHFDHVGGNQELLERTGELPVYGHVSDRGRIPGQTHGLEHEQAFTLLGRSFRALHIPGHTTGALAYVVDGAVFTGDTLFAAGCGRLFEGTPAMMYESLNVRLAALTDDTLVYFGHEYTANNLRFAAHVEPTNAAIAAKQRRVSELRAGGAPTTPSTLRDERATNPFLRCDSAEIARHLSGRLPPRPSPIDVLGLLRAEKDAF